MKYYIKSGDLESILSTNMTPKNACVYAIQKFVDTYRGQDDKSVSTSISVSQRGFRDTESKIMPRDDELEIFDVAEIINLIQ